MVVRTAQKFRDEDLARRNCFEAVLGKDEHSVVFQAPTNAERAAWLERMGGIGPVRTIRVMKSRNRYVGGWMHSLALQGIKHLSECSWCRPPSFLDRNRNSANGFGVADHVLFFLQRAVIEIEKQGLDAPNLYKQEGDASVAAKVVQALEKQSTRAVRRCDDNGSSL